MARQVWHQAAAWGQEEETERLCLESLALYIKYGNLSFNSKREAVQTQNGASL